MPDNFNVRNWVKSLPSRAHPERNEDAYWSATNDMAHAVIDGMGSSRRVVNGREVVTFTSKPSAGATAVAGRR